MANNQDARPFVDLQKDAEEFKAKFEEDIEKCKNLLDAKITALICDPDSLGNSVGPKQNALVEFSKAKYEIYISMKSFMNDLEREWLKYISEMKKLFLENVEIFLAGTKLEVKLPSSEYQSPASKKSPGQRKSLTVGSTFYPIINSITKNIPVLSSPARSREVENTECSKSSRAFSQVEIEDDDMDLNTSWSTSKQKSKLEQQKDFRRSPGTLKNVSCSESHAEETNELESGPSKKSSMRASSRPKITVVPKKNSSNSDDEKVDIKNLEVNIGALPLKGRRGRQTAINQVDTKVVSKKNSSISDDESVDIKDLEVTIDAPPLKGRRGRQTATRQANTEVTSKKSSSNSDENIDNKDLENNDALPLKGRRGRQTATKVNIEVASTKSAFTATSRPKNAAISKKSSSNTSDENGDIKDSKTNNDVMLLKGHRGRQAAINQANTEVVATNSSVRATSRSKNAAISKTNSNNTSDESEDTTDSENNNGVLLLKGHRGRQATIKQANTEDKTSKGPGRAFRRRTVNERIIETEASVSPKKVTFTAEDDDDVMDTYIPVENARSATRRKTLVPNLDQAVSGADLIPETSSRAKYKRKTISNVSDMQSVAPSKRFKSSTNQRNTAADIDEVSADDNLLEADESYSEWIALNSIEGKVPTSPGIYEVKVWRAKKSAYIGYCDSLRQKLTLHKLRQNSGHKHLDKFIDRNFNDIQIRYEVVSSISDAKDKVKNRISSFVAQHKTTPAYN